MQLLGITLSAEKTGAVSARVPFYGTSVTEAINNMASTFLGMQRTGFDMRQEQDGNFMAIGFYEGVMNEGDEDSEERTVYDWSPSFEQADIRTHPKFGELLKKYYGTLDENEEVTWGKYIPQGTGSGGGLGGSGDSTNFIDNPMRGVREYYALGGVWSQKRVYPSIPGDVFTSVGRITDDPPGNLPAAGNRFWLTLPPIVTQRGQKWEVTRRWMLSGEKSTGAKEAAQDIYESLNG